MPDKEPVARVSVREAAQSVLRNANEPLHVKAITEQVVKLEGVQLAGKTPLRTVAATLATAAKNGRIFVRTAPNTYTLLT